MNISEITFASSENVIDLYREQVDLNPALKNVIEKQLIFGPTYSYTYNNEMDKRRKNTFYYKGGIDFSGNIYGLIAGAIIKKGDTIKVFDIPFS